MVNKDLKHDVETRKDVTTSSWNWKFQDDKISIESTERFMIYEREWRKSEFLFQQQWVHNYRYIHKKVQTKI